MRKDIAKKNEKDRNVIIRYIIKIYLFIFIHVTITMSNALVVAYDQVKVRQAISWVHFQPACKTYVT